MTICIIISFKRKSYFSISKISGIIPTLVQLWNFGINQDCQSNPLCNVDDRVSFSFFSLNNRCSCSVVVCRCLGNVCGFAGEGKRKGTSSLYHFYCKLPSLNSLQCKIQNLVYTSSMCLMRLLEEMHSVSGHQIQRDEKVMPNINPSHKYTLFLVFIHPSNNP